MGLMHCEIFPVNGVFCAKPQKFSPSKVLPYTVMYRMMNISICNSYFYNTNQTALEIKARYTFTAKQILVINCTFKFVSTGPSVISISVLPFNKNIRFINCEFYNNTLNVIVVTTEVCKSHLCELSISNVTFPMIPSNYNVSLIRCQFISNSNRLIFMRNRIPELGKVNVIFRSLK